MDIPLRKRNQADFGGPGEKEETLTTSGNSP